MITLSMFCSAENGVIAWWRGRHCLRLIANAAEQLVPKAYGFHVNPRTDAEQFDNRALAKRLSDNNCFHFVVSPSDVVS